MWMVLIAPLLLFGCGNSATEEPPPQEIKPIIFPTVEVLASEEDPAPVAARKYKRALITNARVVWGLDAPVAAFGAQIEQESAWDERARSGVGAMGLAQFMPSTADWISEVYEDLGDNQPFNPAWALRALVRYNKHLFDQISAHPECDRMAFTLSAYNGGLGWVKKDMDLAQSMGLDPSKYWGQVETVNAGRAGWAIRENRDYPRKILLVRQPKYKTWGRAIDCIRQ